MTLKIELQNNYLWSYVDTRPISMILYNKKKTPLQILHTTHTKENPQKITTAIQKKKSHHNDV